MFVLIESSLISTRFSRVGCQTRDGAHTVSDEPFLKPFQRADSVGFRKSCENCTRPEISRTFTRVASDLSGEQEVENVVGAATLTRRENEAFILSGCVVYFGVRLNSAKYYMNGNFNLLLVIVGSCRISYNYYIFQNIFVFKVSRFITAFNINNNYYCYTYN